MDSRVDAARSNPGRRRLFKSLAGYEPGKLGADLIAGLTLAAVAIPEQMATARLGGLPPQLGFFAFMAAALAFFVFGSGRRVSTGADSTITPIFAGGLALLAAGGSPHYIALAAALAVLVGLIVAAAGLFRMGWIGNLLSIPVTTGFLAGIAVHIAVSQLPAALGLPPLTGPTLQRMAELVRLAPRIGPASLAVSAAVLGSIAVMHRVSARLPGPLLAVAAASLAAAWLHLDHFGVALLGPVQGARPRFGLPIVTADEWARLAPLALLISVVVMVQTAATSRSFSGGSDAPDVDGDFFGVGIGSVISGLAGAFPVNASPPRTAILAESGSVSQLAGLSAAAVIALLLAIGAGALAMIPQAALSAVLLFVVLRIVRVKQICALVRESPAEALLVLATAISVVVLPIQAGVAVGIVLSVMNGLWGAVRARIQPMLRAPGTSVWWPAPADQEGDEDTSGILVLGFQAPLTFLNADGFARSFLAHFRSAGGRIKLVILEAAGVVDIDFTAAQALDGVVRACREGGATFALARLESTVAQQALSRLGLRALIGDDRIYPSVAQAVAALAPSSSTEPPLVR